jgi:hypothetical protein
MQLASPGRFVVPSGSVVPGVPNPRGVSRRLLHRRKLAPRIFIRLTDLTLSCAAKAHVPKPKRHAGCRE